MPWHMCLSAPVVNCSFLAVWAKVCGAGSLRHLAKEAIREKIYWL